jgi:hypothetical protein
MCFCLICCRYQNELPKKIKARGKDAHLIHEELVQTMKWKQTVSKHILLLWYCSGILAIVSSLESLSCSCEICYRICTFCTFAFEVLDCNSRSLVGCDTFITA